MVDFKDIDALRKCDALDCRPPPAPQADWLPRRLLRSDYNAKDFDSFLRLMLDEVSRTLPGWRDRSEADLGMTVLELCAYFADHLSYYQDRVLREGRIGTASQFESIRSLLRLINYHPSLGRSAWTYASFEVAQPKLLPLGFEIASVPEAESGKRVVFHVGASRVLRPELNQLLLAADAPTNPARNSARLLLADPTLLAVGDLLALSSGQRVQVVTVAEPPSAGPGPNVSTVVFEPSLAEDFAVADSEVFANVALLHHGERLPSSASERLVLARGEANQRIALSLAPISRVTKQAQSSLSVSIDGVPWTEVDNFLLSDSAAEHFVVTYDNSHFGTIVLGDGIRGRVPAAGAQIEVDYRIGLGRAGLVARGTLVQFDDPEGRIVSVSSLLPSDGGREPDTLDELRLLGPASVRKQQRVVSLLDYERVATEALEVDGQWVTPLHARAERGFTGTWEVVTVVVDLRTLPAATLAALETKLSTQRLAAREAVVRSARYAPLNLALTVEVGPGFFQRHVRAELEVRFESFFAPTRFGFGDGVSVSAVVGAAMEVDGVLSVCPTRFKRLGDRFAEMKDVGVIRVGADEIPRCDRDPNNPDNGVLTLKFVGGKAG